MIEIHYYTLNICIICVFRVPYIIVYVSGYIGSGNEEVNIMSIQFCLSILPEREAPLK